MKKFFLSILFVCCAWAVPAQQMFVNEELTVSRLANRKNVWVVETRDNCTMYIIEGRKRALLIDTGTKNTALDQVVRRFTRKPLDVVITHLHPDHAGNVGYFDSAWVHPADTVMLHEYGGCRDKFRFLHDGQRFDLGGTVIETIHTPGHTPGSVVFADKATGDCFTGDAFGSGQVWLQLEPHVPMTEYLASCRRVERLMERGEVKSLWCGHYPYVKTCYGLDYLQTMEQLAARLVKGDTIGSVPFTLPPSVHNKGNARVLSDPSGRVAIVYNADKILAEYSLHRDVPYVSATDSDSYRRERCKLDIYMPRHMAHASVVVWFHGGGMESGEKYIPEILQRKGIGVVAVNYRLSPMAKRPAYIEDAAAAVAWVRRNIARYGGDPRRIYVSGHSAGGYLSLMLAMDKHWLARYGEEADSIAAYLPVSGQTVTHFTIRKERGLPFQIPVVDELAPIRHARPDTAPILLLTGDRRMEMASRWEENAWLESVLRSVGNKRVGLYELQGFSHVGVHDAALTWLVHYVLSH